MKAHGWVAGICQPWGLYTIWGLAVHSGGPCIPQAPTFHLYEVALNWWPIYSTASMKTLLA